MGRKFKVWVISLVVMCAAMTGLAEESTRKFQKSWPVQEVATLRINNKFGEVWINHSGGTMVTVDVLVTVEGSGNRAKEMLDDITVTFGKSGGTVSAETEIKNNFRSKNKLSINYTVNIPSDKNLDVSNKFGNVVLDKLTGKGDIDVAYGNLRANQLEGPETNLNVEYGKADIQRLGNAGVYLAYSKLFLGSGENIQLDVKYSTVTADKLLSLNLDSKYDSFNFGELVTLKGESKFSNYKIGTLTKILDLTSAYGTVKVDNVPEDFEQVIIQSSYAQISLGIEESTSYQVEAKCDFCDIVYPSGNFKGRRMKENTSQSLSGKIGGGSGGLVKVTSKFGNIKLVK